MEPAVGEALCQLILNAPKPFPVEPIKNRRQMNFNREGFQNDSSPINRGQMQREMHNNASSTWFDPWSQSNT